MIQNKWFTTCMTVHGTFDPYVTFVCRLLNMRSYDVLGGVEEQDLQTL